VSSPGRRTFTAVVERDANGRIVILLPFDPSETWGPKTRHHIAGTIGGLRIRTTLPGQGSDARAVMGHACEEFDIGESVEVVLEPEGPQLDSLGPDLADALTARPEALDFFLSLATFYRKGYLHWVDATKRKPDVRAARIAELVDLLAAGQKERPRAE
jgi:Bacteriocin-protection, YdeI or OmpD-Associated